ncbi:MAG: VOC family protein [Clostridiales bacterium]|nr:VOC family protein [Clostridiales bacterium]
MKIDHIGYAVKQIDRALSSFKKLGFQFYHMIEDHDRNIKIIFGEKNNYRIELVCPLDKTKKSPVDAYLSKIGPTPYHICYQSANLEDDIENLKKQGFRVIIDPERAVAFNGKRVVFMMNPGLGLMEIVET